MILFNAALVIINGLAGAAFVYLYATSGQLFEMTVNPEIQSLLKVLAVLKKVGETEPRLLIPAAGRVAGHSVHDCEQKVQASDVSQSLASHIAAT